MTISYPLSLPASDCRAKISLTAHNVSEMTRSRFTMEQQVFAHSGQVWMATVTLPPLYADDAKAWIAWLVSLRGSVGTFLMGDPVSATPRGSAGGTPLVNGAGQTGTTLAIDGATASQTGWLKAGDHIQLGSGTTSRLHMVLQDVDTDGSGNASIDIWPSLRSSPADNAALTLTSPMTKWRLMSGQIGWEWLPAHVEAGLTFSAIEAMP